ncbi:type II toxin-antitoxin system RatA family toxin [Marinospirillum alkaliphilum]|uniref:Ribosome association toxin PasT (RatA) of the RatAB toxin-antitoxin module n=1 Tax=Marinospirillum alkaliphilum DSM 21637 TaxID=1122209 RepID=A0A1K1Y862_9GAMM|nr:type II toxin-antitoxin system RatA family toxin [Marinospirillum alkaliphilum]SFX57918.1 Ribosome association toxin PasT (RatA) of the RatAB toxin-antitoxin module [Marinospirillum alkaliphilum DSM 21637]
MSRISRSALVMHSAKEMFDLVNDCESYPKFLPGCSDARLIHREEAYLVGELELSKAGMSYRFTTRNELFEPERIELKLVDGPFRKLEGRWVFQPLAEYACKVSFDLDFEIAGKVISAALSPLFSQMAASQVDAFVKRADEVYGKHGG